MSIRVIPSEYLIGANNDLRAQNERQRNQLASLNAAYERMGSERDRIEAENVKLRQLVEEIDEVADPFLWEFIARRMHELGIDRWSYECD